MISVKPKFQALSLRLRSPAGAVKMPLAQAHPFQPMAVTHEEELHEVSNVDSFPYTIHFPFFAQCTKYSILSFLLSRKVIAK